METIGRAGGRRLALILAVLGLLAAALAAPGAAAAAGGDVLWTFSFAGAGADHAVAVPAGPDGSVLLCADGMVAGRTEAVALLETESKTLQWGLVWGDEVDGGAHLQAAVRDPRTGSLYLVTSVSDPVHRTALVVVKADTIGHVVWTRTYSSLSLAQPNAAKAAVDRRGNLYLAGTSMVGGEPGSRQFLVKLSPGGVLGWERTWTGGTVQSMLRGLAVTAAGRTYCAVLTTGIDGSVAGSVRAFGNSGRTLWSRSFGGSSGDRWANALVQAPGGAVIVAGGRRRSGAVQGVVEKYDDAGRMLWRRAVSTGAGGAGFIAAAVDARGRVFAVGKSGVPGPLSYVVGLEPTGRVRWTSQSDHEGWPSDIVVAGSRLYVDTTLAQGAADDHALVGAQCLAAGTGARIWSHEYDTGAGSSRAEVKGLTVVPGRSVYVAATIWVDGRFTDAVFWRLQP